MTKIRAGYLAAIAATAVGVAAVGGLALNQMVITSSLTYDPPTTVAAPPAVLTPAAAPTTDETRQQLADQLTEAANDPVLGQFTGVVVDGVTGDTLWQFNPRPERPASVTKLLTAASVLHVLDPQQRFTTTVVAGADPGTVVLVGGGDVMLSEEKLAELAATTVAKHPAPIKNVVVDISLFSPMTVAPSWHVEDIPGGYVAPIQPVMLYGGRIGDTSGDVPRSNNPAQDVALRFAELVAEQAASRGQAAETPTANATPNPVATTGEVLASVESATVGDQVREMLQNSDNVIAEALGRQVALARGVIDPDSAGAATAVLQVLAEQQLPTQGVELVDTSGLSDLNRITPDLLVAVLQQSLKDGRLDALRDGLPVAAATGTLYPRFSGNPGAGYVHAKTGTLLGVSSLAGITNNSAGHVYVFAFIAEDTNAIAARGALDRLAGILSQ